MNGLASGLHGELLQGDRHLRVTIHASFHFVAILSGLYSASSLTLFLCDRRLYADQGARVKKKKKRSHHITSHPIIIPSYHVATSHLVSYYLTCVPSGAGGVIGRHLGIL